MFLISINLVEILLKLALNNNQSIIDFHYCTNINTIFGFTMKKILSFQTGPPLNKAKLYEDQQRKKLKQDSRKKHEDRNSKEQDSENNFDRPPSYKEINTYGSNQSSLPQNGYRNHAYRETENYSSYHTKLWFYILLIYWDPLLNMWLS